MTRLPPTPEGGPAGAGVPVHAAAADAWGRAGRTCDAAPRPRHRDCPFRSPVRRNPLPVLGELFTSRRNSKALHARFSTENRQKRPETAPSQGQLKPAQSQRHHGQGVRGRRPRRGQQARSGQLHLVAGSQAATASAGDRRVGQGRGRGGPRQALRSSSRARPCQAVSRPGRRESPRARPTVLGEPVTAGARVLDRWLRLPRRSAGRSCGLPVRPRRLSARAEGDHEPVGQPRSTPSATRAPPPTWSPLRRPPPPGVGYGASRSITSPN